MGDIDVDALRKVAEAATPGPWVCYGDHLVWPSEKGPAANDPIIGMVGEAHDDCAAHIAAFDPPTVLALLDRLEAAEAKVARVEVLLSERPPAKFDGDNYEGRVGGTEHRTTGGRAWCYQCSEWCYPESYACPCCEPPVDPDDLRAALEDR